MLSWGPSHAILIVLGSDSVPSAQKREGHLREGNKSPKVTQMICGGASIWTQACSAPKLCTFFHSATRVVLKPKPDQDTPLSKCHGDFLSSRDSYRTLSAPPLPASLATSPSSSCLCSLPSSPTDFLPVPRNHQALRATTLSIPSAWNAVLQALCRSLFLIQVSAPMPLPKVGDIPNDSA